MLLGDLLALRELLNLFDFRHSKRIFNSPGISFQNFLDGAAGGYRHRGNPILRVFS